MLSNTATPKYYAEFRDKVIRGEIPVCEEISLQMNRIEARIANPEYYYDDSAVECWIRFCERELTLTDGSTFEMLDTFKLWGEDFFGWYYFTDVKVYSPELKRFVIRKKKKRLCFKQYLIVARGAAKSMYDYFIQSYFLVVDTSTTHQITTAPTMRQAEEVLSPFRTALARSPGPLFKMLTDGSLQNTTGSKAKRQKLASTKKGIECLLTNSLLEVRPMSIDKLQGLRCKISTVDEWLSVDIREDPISALEQGGSKIDGYAIIATSSEGCIRNGPGDDIKLELAKILRGEYSNEHVSIWWYKLDSVKEVAEPYYWLKANPNLGITISYETYQLDVERAENSPAARNDILAKRFGIPMEGYTYFFTYAETLVHRTHDFSGMQCALGMDASQGDDFWAFSFLFPLSDGSFGLKARCYISSLTYSKLAPTIKEKYDEFIREGSLVVMECSILDHDDIFDDLASHIERFGYDVRAFGYDPYNAKAFVARWEIENGPYGTTKVIQGARTESVPLGELKDLAEKRMLIFDEFIVSFCMGHAVTIEDTNGNRKLYKMRYESKIDVVASTMDALVGYKIGKEMF